MTCAERRDRLVDRLYGLLGDAEAAELDRHVAACPECRREWGAVQGRDALLDHWTPSYRPTAPVRFPAPRRAAGLAWAAAALVIALTTTILFPAPGRYEIVRGTARAGLSPGQEIKADSAATLELGLAGRIDLEPGAELVYRGGGPDLDHELELRVGMAHVDVFPTGHAFRLALGERRVEVRGTRFSVRRFSRDELARELGEESMKAWNTASLSVALITVTSGAVVLTGPDGPHPLSAGRSVLATPSGVDQVDAGESFAALRQVRDDMLRSLADREEKTRAAREAVAALKLKQSPDNLPPGATLESLTAALRDAYAKGDESGMQRATVHLGAFLRKDPNALLGLLKMLSETKDPHWATLLSSSVWYGGIEHLDTHRAEVIKLLLTPGMPADVRAALLGTLGGALNGIGSLTDTDCAAFLRTARELSGADAATARLVFGRLVAQSVQSSFESWGDFRRFLEWEPEGNVREQTIHAYFFSGRRKKPTAQGESLLLDSIQGRFGLESAADVLSEPLLPYFGSENGPAFAEAFGKAAQLLPERQQRQEAAGQLALLHLIHRTPAALDALRRVSAAETDPDARSRMGDVVQSLEKGSLDLETLMEKLQLSWSF
jgi:hypothetical protein